MASNAQSIIEKNKQRQAALAGKTDALAPAKPKETKAPVKIGSAEEAKEKIEKKPKAAQEGNPKYKCGHEVPLKSAANQDCPACSQKRKHEKALKKGEGKRQANALINTRLPNGSKFDIEPFDYVRVTWTGRLIIPQGNGKDNLVFEGKFGAIFGLLKMLDKQYRVWLEQQKKEENPVAKKEGT